MNKAKPSLPWNSPPNVQEMEGRRRCQCHQSSDHQQSQTGVSRSTPRKELRMSTWPALSSLGDIDVHADVVRLAQIDQSYHHRGGTTSSTGLGLCCSSAIITRSARSGVPRIGMGLARMRTPTSHGLASLEQAYRIHLSFGAHGGLMLADVHGVGHKSQH